MSKSSLVSLTAKLCDGRLQKTFDGQWYTNGCWAVRSRWCETAKSTPPLGDAVDQEALKNAVSSCAVYRKGQALRKLVVRGAYPVVAEGEIVAWLDSRYAAAFVGEKVWAAGPLDPLLVGMSPAWIDVWVIIMPMRDPFIDDERALLRSYLAG